MIYFNNNHNLKNKRYTHGANVTQPFANEQNAKQVFYKRLADVCKRSLLGGAVMLVENVEAPGRTDDSNRPHEATSQSSVRSFGNSKARSGSSISNAR